MLQQQAGNALHSASHCCSLFVFFVVTIIKKPSYIRQWYLWNLLPKRFPQAIKCVVIWFEPDKWNMSKAKQSMALQEKKVVTSWQLWRSERLLQWQMACSEKWKQRKGQGQRPQTGSTRGWPKIEMSNGFSLWQMLIGMQTFPRWQQAHVYVESRDAARCFFKRNTVFARRPGEGVSRFLVHGGYYWLPRRAYMASQWQQVQAQPAVTLQRQQLILACAFRFQCQHGKSDGEPFGKSCVKFKSTWWQFNVIGSTHWQLF